MLLESDDNKFDLIITDIKMSGLDGFDFIEKIDEMGLNTPVVVESAYLSDDSRMNKLKDRVRAFVKKPIDLNVLESIVIQIESELNHH